MQKERREGAAPIDEGWAALSSGDWAGARAAFEEALADGETPEALEGIGWAGQMLNEDRLTFDARAGLPSLPRPRRQELSRPDSRLARRRLPPVSRRAGGRERLAPACAQPHRRPRARRRPRLVVHPRSLSGLAVAAIPWRGYEACNCAFGCPCNMNGFPTHGYCEGTLAFEVLEGERDGVDLAGAKAAGSVKWPGAIHEGSGVAAIFLDGTDEQREALVAILTGEDPGLPWEILAATISEIHGPFAVPIEITDEGTDSHVRAGDMLEIKMESFTNPVSGEKHEVHMLLPDGFIFTDGKIATTSVHKLDADGVTFDHPGNNAYYSEVVWSSENRMAPAEAAGRFG